MEILLYHFKLPEIVNLLTNQNFVAPKFHQSKIYLVRIQNLKFESQQIFLT